MGDVVEHEISHGLRAINEMGQTALGGGISFPFYASRNARSLK
jgi:hypothetical protein